MNHVPPRVTVIMVVRNGADHVAEALESILLSDLRPHEILVIDGGSTDATVAIARRVDGVRVIPQVGRGIASAYNQAIAAASGEYLTFLSHDDVWLPGKLDRQVALMRSDPALMYCVTLVEHFLDAGAVPPPGFRTELLNRTAPGFLMESLMVRTEAFARVGLFNPAFPVSEDSDWFMRARDAGLKMAILPEVLIRKRVHAGSATMQERSTSRLLLTALRGSIARKRASGA